MVRDDSPRSVRPSVLSDGWTFVVGAGIGVLITAISLLSIAAFRGSDAGPSEGDRGAALSDAGRSPDGRTAAASDDAGSSSGGDTAQSLREQCQEVFRAQIPARKAAKASLRQWDVHVDAMNKLVSGEITLQQATVFWDQTRVGAEQRLATYDATRDVLDQTPASCPAKRTDEADGATMTCMHAVQAHASELRKAAAALKTWRHHVHHMEMLRNGEMSPARATRLWQQNWKLGARQLDAYHAAELVAAGQRC